MMMMTPRVLLAEHLAIVREGLQALLENSSFTVIAEPVEGPEIVEIAKESQPDAAILDAAMPGLNGIEIARHLNEFSRPIPSILLTTSVETEDVALAFAAGVRGYVLKSQRGSQLIEALRLVLGGGLYISPKIPADAVCDLWPSTGLRSEVITQREKELLKLIAEGK